MIYKNESAITLLLLYQFPCDLGACLFGIFVMLHELLHQVWGSYFCICLKEGQILNSTLSPFKQQQSWIVKDGLPVAFKEKVK